MKNPFSIFSNPSVAPGGNSPGPISDLDALIQEPIPFKLKGKIHFIEPITTEVFFKTVNRLEAMDRLKTVAEDVTVDVIINAYYQLFASICKTITMDDVRGMSQPQCLALLQLVIDSITGRAQAEAEDVKKKSQIVALRESSPPAH